MLKSIIKRIKERRILKVESDLCDAEILLKTMCHHCDEARNEEDMGEPCDCCGKSVCCYCRERWNST